MTAGTPWSGGEVRAEGLVLRHWTPADVPCLVRLFDTAEMDRWTPLPHPFDADVAVGYAEAARRGLENGTLQLAVTTDGARPLGEVLLFPTDEPATCELAYAIGSEHRGQRLAARAVSALLRRERKGYVLHLATWRRDL